MLNDLVLFIVFVALLIGVAIILIKRDQDSKQPSIKKSTKNRNALDTAMIPNSVVIDENYLPNLKNKKYFFGKRFNAFICHNDTYYHKSKCPKLNNKKKTVIHRYIALQNYKPCPICSPVDYIDSWYIDFLKKNWDKVTDTTYQNVNNNKIKNNLPKLFQVLE